MKNFIIVFLSLILWSCGGDDDSIPEEIPPVNEAPSIPVQVYPIKGSLCTENPLDIKWESSVDSEGDQISYEVQISTKDDFSSDLQSQTSSSLNANFTMIKGVAYYWRIRSKDAKNNFSDYSNNWNYYTEGEGVVNHLPFSPTLVGPEVNSIVADSSSKLEWTASDVDSDPIVYDVYFGNTNPPAMVQSDVSATTYNVELDGVSKYYWKIVVKDGKGGQTNGQVWSFESE